MNRCIIGIILLGVFVARLAATSADDANVEADRRRRLEELRDLVASLCAERVAVSLDQREIWKEELFTKPGARDTYINGHFKADDPSKSDQQRRIKGTDQ